MRKESSMGDYRVRDFLEILASGEPVPGGGGASAAVGAMSVALGMMVANLTIGRKKYAEVEEDVKKLLARGQGLMEELTALMDKDAEAFEPLSKAYGLPKNTEEEKKAREAVMAKALYEASVVPMEIMRKSLEVMDILQELSKKGSKIAMSDVGVGVLFARSAVEGASLNVFINTKLMKDREQAEKMNQETDDMITKGRRIAEEVYNSVLNQIKGGA